MPNNVRIVLFKRGNGKYVKDDVVGLPEEEAERYVKLGYALFLGEHECGVIRAIPPNLPQQEKIKNLCAICGAEFETGEEKAEHKKNEHGI